MVQRGELLREAAREGGRFRGLGECGATLIAKVKGGTCGASYASFEVVIYNFNNSELSVKGGPVCGATYNFKGIQPTLLQSRQATGGRGGQVKWVGSVLWQEMAGCEDVVAFWKNREEEGSFARIPSLMDA